MTATAITRTDLEGLSLVHRGKVRDVYAVSSADVGDALLIVATDRVSAYDCVLSPGIPDKGRVLTSMSVFWFDVLKDVVGNHLITADVDAMPAAVRRHRNLLAGRAMLCRRLKMFPVECVARGYLTGSGWKDYRRTGEVSGHRLPPGLVECEKLSPPLYTPSTKAEVGHDLPIDYRETERLVGPTHAAALRDLTLAVFTRATQVAEARGILLADTKLEFGLDAAGRVTLGDEVLTPDSSRFWDAKRYVAGRGQASYDKQQIRDWLDAAGWDHTPPPPPLPPDVVSGAATTYREIHRRLTGRDLP